MFIVVVSVASAHLVLRAAPVAPLDTYTLVHYVGSKVCNSKRQVCQSGLGTTSFSQLSQTAGTICAKLHEKDGVFEVDACQATGEACPSDTCGDCKGFFHSGLILDKCQDGYMLVKGDMTNCTQSDVALGRWCNKVPSDRQNATEKAKAGNKPKANETATLASLMQKIALPSQGFEGEHVDHDNYQTVTDDWRTEYGPRKASCAAMSMLALLVVI